MNAACCSVSLLLIFLHDCERNEKRSFYTLWGDKRCFEDESVKTGYDGDASNLDEPVNVPDKGIRGATTSETAKRATASGDVATSAKRSTASADGDTGTKKVTTTSTKIGIYATRATASGDGDTSAKTITASGDGGNGTSDFQMLMR